MADKERWRRAWYAQPVVWLGVLVLLLSIVGVVWLIVASSSLEDEALPTNARLFGVPLQSQPTPSR